MSGYSEAELTNSRVDRAGKLIRKTLTQQFELDGERFYEALDVLLGFRALHQAPLTTANMGLRSMVKTERCSGPEISQRLKRIPTILGKLTREPTLALSRMQDLGGCRAVLSTIDEVYRVRSRLEGAGRVDTISDYIAAPRSSGYRGVHVVVRYHGRRIEVQLRTRVMHQWAVTVEQLSAVLGEDVKSGLGPPPVQALMQAISQAMAVEESGGMVDDELLGTIQQRRTDAAPFLSGGRRT